MEESFQQLMKSSRKLDKSKRNTCGKHSTRKEYFFSMKGCIHHFKQREKKSGTAKERSFAP